MKHSAIEIGTQIDADAPEFRTLETMLADAADHPAPTPEELAQRQLKPFLPTIPADQYADLKSKLQAEATTDKPLDAQAEGQPLAPIILVGPNLAGATNVDGLAPPDTHGAVGLDHFVEVTNSHIDIFLRANNARTSISLAAFLGYTNRVLFDPRVVYDSVWNRWIVTSDAFQESATLQWHFIAVSTTSNALGPYYIYRINVAFNSGDFWDYPQLGMDQDAIIITANIFMASGAYRGTDMFAVAKARLYNGLGFSVPLFTGLRGTLAPPIVLDQNGRTFLIAASGGTTLSLYTLTNSSTPNTIGLTGPVNITVPAYVVPPDAPQPGTATRLDTLDGRFVNASTQTGDFLWQAHTVGLAGYAAPKFYQINIVTNTVVRNAFFFGTSTSYDFNVAIAANSANDIFVTWTMTDPPQNINAQVRFSGFDHNTGPTYILGPGTAAFTSPTWYSGTRWGDYSAVTLDPRNARRAWVVNENALASHNWGSRIVGIGF
ncbi:MAG TPA: hypothetical protein VGC21_24815 [Telluria sp.]|jgi:hypothetical protein